METPFDPLLVPLLGFGHPIHGDRVAAAAGAGAWVEWSGANPSPGLWALGVVPMAAVVCLTGLAIQKPAEWSQDRLMLSAIINLERLETINAFGKAPYR